jgi:hypothetical protein
MNRSSTLSPLEQMELEQLRKRLTDAEMKSARTNHDVGDSNWILGYEAHSFSS